MSHNIGNSYERHITETRTLLREMLNIINRQDRHLEWIDRVQYQNIMQQQNRNTQNQLSQISQSRQRNLSRPTLADILSAAIMTEFSSTMNPVVVRPTANVISNATETIPFLDISSPQYNRCPISHEDFDNNSAVTRIRYCGHYFDPQAISHWLTTSVRCPVCRHDIRTGIETQPNNVDSSSDAAGVNNTQDINEDNEPNEESNEPNNLSNLMDIVSRDIQNNRGYNTSIHLEFIPNLHNVSTFLDPSNNITDISGIYDISGLYTH